MKLSNNMPQKILFKAFFFFFFTIYTRENRDSKNDLRYSQFMQKSDLIGHWARRYEYFSPEDWSNMD